MEDSPAVILYDAAGVAMAVQNGVAIPASTRGLLPMVSDAGTARRLAGDGVGRAVVVGAGAAGTPTGGVATVQGDPAGTPVPVSVGALALPTGAATEATLATRAADATLTARLGTLGQKAAAGSTPVVLASDQTLPLPTGAATSANQTTANASLSSLDGKTPALGPQRAVDAAPVVLANEHLDAFSRIRISDLATLFDSQLQYGDNAQVWENLAAGTGSVSNALASSSVLMTTGGTASGAKLTRQTRIHHRYQPGKSQLAFLTFVFTGGAKANVRRRAGYFNGGDGYFLELDGSDVRFVERTSTSGSPVDTVFAQAGWNLDRLDGGGGANNRSGINLDLTKSQILVIDLQWLGAGRVRVGFDINGFIVYAHEFRHANIVADVYMKTANLPFRFEVENTGLAASATTLQQICAALMSEGGFESQRAYQYAAGRGVTPLGVTTRRPVLSLRAKTTGPNGVRNTGHILPRHVNINATTNTAYYEVVLNPATLTGAAFNAFNADNSIAEIDTAATALTGGLVVDSGFVSSGAANAPSNVVEGFFRDFPLIYTGLNNVQDVLTLVITSTNATTNILADVAWREIW